MTYSIIELCTGAGGQAIGLEQAGLTHVFGVDTDRSHGLGITADTLGRT